MNRANFIFLFAVTVATFTCGCQCNQEKQTTTAPPVTKETAPPRNAPFLKPVELETEKQILHRYHEWLDYLQNELGTIADKNRPVTIESIGTDSIGIREGVTEISGPIKITLNLKTGNLASFRSILADELNESEYEGEAPAVSQKTREKIRSYCEAALVKLVPAHIRRRLRLDDGTPQSSCLSRWEGPNLILVPNDVEFEDSPDSVFKGQWHAYWSLFDGEHSYAEEGAGIAVSEKYGIIMFTCSNKVPNISEVESKISRERAISLASAATSKIFNTKDEWLKVHYSGLDLGPVAYAKLLVINPNRIFDEDRDIKDVHYRSNRWRLAWEVVFYSKEKGKPDDDYIAGTRTITVHVDAATGEILGGGFGL